MRFPAQLRRAGKRVRDIKVVRPRTARHLRHPTEQPALRSRAQQDVIVRADRDEGRTAPEASFALLCLAREAFLVAANTRGAGVAPWT